MPSHQHADQPTDVGAVDALISETQELRGKVDAVRRDAPFEAVDQRSRWQRALYDLAVLQLQDVGAHLGQLREGITPCRESCPAGPGQPSSRAQSLREACAGPGYLGRAGSAEWYLLTDEVVWSEEMYEIFDRDPQDGPLTLDELSPYLYVEDQASVTAMVTACLVDGSPIDGEFRIVRPDGDVRTVHMVGEPVQDADGSTLSMWAVVRDVSDLRRGERVAREARESLRHLRQRERAEHRMAVQLQEAVLPSWLDSLSFPRGGPRVLDLAARYVPAGTSELVGGDWYDAMDLPDGSVLLTVGDLAGHGVSAISGTAMLLGALRGMALAGLEPGTLMHRLNELMDRSVQPVLGSAVCCRFDPEDRTLTWAQAGHPAPLLYRGGGARALASPEGVLLGADRGAHYGQRTEQLAPGDVLILHTDGLIPRPCACAADQEQQLLALAPRIARSHSAQDCVRVIAERFGAPERGDDGCVLAARVC